MIYKGQTKDTTHFWGGKGILETTTVEFALITVLFKLVGS